MLYLCLTYFYGFRERSVTPQRASPGKGYVLSIHYVQVGIVGKQYLQTFNLVNNEYGFNPYIQIMQKRIIINLCVHYYRIILLRYVVTTRITAHSDQDTKSTDGVQDVLKVTNAF
jgi:hypothetical protein